MENGGTRTTARSGNVPFHPLCANAQLRVVRSRWSLAGWCRSFMTAPTGREGAYSVELGTKNSSPKRKRRDYLNRSKAMIAGLRYWGVGDNIGRKSAQIIMSLTHGSPLGLHALRTPPPGGIFRFIGFGTFRRNFFERRRFDSRWRCR